MKLNEKIAMRNLKNAFNFEVGSACNAYMDGETDFPTIEEMKIDIYYGAMNDLYSGGACYVDLAPKEMRFAGKEFCMAYLDKLFEEDGDVAEIPWAEEKGE